MPKKSELILYVLTSFPTNGLLVGEMSLDLVAYKEDNSPSCYMKKTWGLVKAMQCKHYYHEAIHVSNMSTHMLDMDTSLNTPETHI